MCESNIIIIKKKDEKKIVLREFNSFIEYLVEVLSRIIFNDCFRLYILSF